MSYRGPVARTLVLVATLGAGCGRLGFETSSIGAPDASAGDAAPTVDAGSETPFVRCDGVDDGIDYVLPVGYRIRTLEMRVRVPDAEGAQSGNYMVRAHTAQALESAGYSIDTVNPPPGLRANLAANAASTSVSGGRAIGTGWMHVAQVISESGATTRQELYLDGTHDVGAAGPPSPIPDFDTIELCRGLGMVFTRIDIDWVRLSSTPRYAGTFAPPAQPVVDPDTVVLLDFDDPGFDNRVGTGYSVIVGGPMVVTP